MSNIEQLAAKVRNHEESEFTGEDSQDAVIRQALETELSRLDEQAELREEIDEKKAELKENLGLSSETELDESETATDAAAKRAELRERITGDK